MDDYIGFYEREFYVLSNFSSFKIFWKGMYFDTSEHVYHWEKFSNNAVVQKLICNSISAHAAFKLAQSCRHLQREDWNDVKEDIMLEILFAKAEQHEYVKRKLLETDDKLLVEDSWRDDYWGWGPNKDGKNALGKLWMIVRDKLRE